MTNTRPGFPPPSGAPPSAYGGTVERRRAPRIAPLSADIYTGAPAAVARQSTLPELKAQARRPGEASFFFFDHHFSTMRSKCSPGSISSRMKIW